LDVLTGAHREYRRKNTTVLLGQVEACLGVIRSTGGVKKREAPQRVVVGGGSSSAASSVATEAQPSGSGAGTSSRQQHEANSSSTGSGGSNAGDKRKRSSTEEQAYDISARQHDTVQNPGGSTMLNSGLRTRYAELQRGRDVEERRLLKKKEEEEEEKEKEQQANADDDADDHGNDSAVDGGGVTDNDTAAASAGSAGGARSNTPVSPLPASADAGATAASAPGASPNAVALKKRRKKISRASSSQGGGTGGGRISGTGTSGGGGGDFGPESLSDRNLIEPTPTPTARYSQLGGIDKIITQIRQIIEYPLTHPEVFHHLGVDPPRGVLLRGPPGCGKSVLADAIAGELGVTYYKVSAPEIVTGISGDSERQIRALFRAAADNAPAIIFVDEIDVIAPKRGESGGGGGRGMEKRMVAQLLTCLDDLNPQKTRGGAPVMVLGATNRPDSIDSALRRAGRFDREISLNVPDEDARVGILKCMTGGMRVEGEFDYRQLARKTPGFVGADIRSLCKESAVIAVNRIFKSLLPESAKQHEGIASAQNTGDASVDDATVSTVATMEPLTPEQLLPLYLTMEDFLSAIKHVQPSSKREGFATVPDVSWDNIGALRAIREELTLSVLEPISHPEKFKQLGLPLPAGVLLYGPPGCGKTLLAKAIANESGANFMSVKGPELLDKYVGESERAVRVLFDRARSSSPCIVFFDELDSLCPKRGSESGSGGGGVSERVVNQLLTEMDGLDERRSIFVIAATNRPELIDPAMMRPGRLDKLLYVPLPTPDDRVAILRAVASKVSLGSDVDLEQIGRSPRAEGYSGADCTALIREAGLAVLRDDTLTRRGFRSSVEARDSDDKVPETKDVPHELLIHAKHFDYAFNHVLPSVSKRDQARYDRMRDRMARARSRGTNVAEEGGGDATAPTAKSDARTAVPN